MINIVKVLHHHYFYYNAFFQHKILKALMKLNVGLVVQIQLTQKELSWTKTSYSHVYNVRNIRAALL